MVRRFHQEGNHHRRLGVDQEPEGAEPPPENKQLQLLWGDRIRGIRRRKDLARLGRLFSKWIAALASLGVLISTIIGWMSTWKPK